MVLKGVYPIVNDEIVDFGAIEKLLHYILYTELRIDPKDHPLILVEQPLTSPTQREKLCEILFETFNIPALLIVDAALADVMSVGISSGLIIRLANPTYIIPVWNSISQTGNIKKIPLGITQMTRYLVDLLEKIGVEFHTASERNILKDIRDKLCYVALDPDKEICKKAYIMPDGSSINLEKELFLAPEIYFKPSMLDPKTEIKPLDIEVFDTIMKIDDSIRKDMAKNIILSGTKINGMKERLRLELEKLVTFPIEIKQAEHHSSWIGSSLIGNLKTVQYPSKYWMTRKEYRELGPKIIHSKVGPPLST